MSSIKDKVNGLLKELKDRNEGALEELYQSTHTHLKIVALNYLSDPSDVDDVLNDAFYKIYKYCASADLNKDGYNWMCKIVQNTAYDYNKRRRVICPIDRVESQKVFSDILDDTLRDNTLFRIIETFPEADQRMLYLKFWEDLSYKEIAIKLNMKKITVYKRLQRILKVISKNYDN